MSSSPSFLPLSTLRLPLPLTESSDVPQLWFAVNDTLVSTLLLVFTDQRVRVDPSGVRHEAAQDDDVLHATLRKSSDT